MTKVKVRAMLIILMLLGVNVPASARAVEVGDKASDCELPSAQGQVNLR